MAKVFVIGTGPGSKDYLLPAALKRIKKSDCIIGARRLLDLFKNLQKEEIPIENRFHKIIPYIKNHKDKKKIAVLVSGDTGLYSLLERISKELGRDEYEVIPGVSALQVAFARIGESWQGAKIISLHGRSVDELIESAKENSKLFIFTDPEFPPNEIALYLLKKGIENRRAIVLENISYPREKIVDTDLKHLSKMKGFGLCVMIIKKER